MPKKIPSAETVEAAVKKAAALKRAEKSELPDGGKDMPPQFGNNFYLVFKARKLGYSDSVFYLESAKALGEPWQRFLAENAGLLAEIDAALDEEIIYKDLFRLFCDFGFAGDVEGGEAFDRKFHPDLGIVAIGIPIWQKLNALLVRAAEAMRKVGIDPTQFY